MTGELKLDEAADGQSVDIGKGGKRGVGFHAEHDAIGQHVIIAALHARQEASRSRQRCPIGRNTCHRARCRRQSRLRRVGGPIRIAVGEAEMAADIEPGPVVGRRDRRRLQRHRIDDRYVSSVTARCRKNADCHDTTQRAQICFDKFDHRVRHNHVFDQKHVGIRHVRLRDGINLASKTVVAPEAVDNEAIYPSSQRTAQRYRSRARQNYC